MHRDEFGLITRDFNPEDPVRSLLVVKETSPLADIPCVEVDAKPQGHPAP
jgi:hypothetical protein